jgi:hypothetical protein
VSIKEEVEFYIDVIYSTVPDNKSRNIPEIVLVRRWVGQTGSVYKQPETKVDDSCHC